MLEEEKRVEPVFKNCLDKIPVGEKYQLTIKVQWNKSRINNVNQTDIFLNLLAKLLKHKDKNSILKAAREKRYIMFM